MPRRKHPLLPRATANRSAAEVLRPVIRDIVQRRSLFATVPRPKQEALIDKLVDAVGYAKAGLADVLAGKQAKPKAWTADIFVRDVCDVLRQAGRRVSMNPNPKKSHAQSFIKELMEAAGLPDAGKLFKQMQRARDIEKKSLPDICVEVTVVWSETDDGQLDVPLR